MNYSFKLTGMRHIEQLASKQVSNVLDEIRDDAILRAPKDTLDLAKSIEKDHISGDLEGRVWVGTDYWAPNEYGAKPHTIRVRDKQVLTDGETFFGTEVNHPGQPAQPFMRPALMKRRVLRKDKA